jgi:Putative N-acetylmannosamine-6-phosphate epimerase
LIEREGNRVTYKEEILKNLKGKLIVSCQALKDEPLHSSMIMGKMALAAKMGGAAGIRSNTVEDISEIKKQVDLPVIGIIKANYADSEIYITPTFREIDALIHSPAEIIAMDATNRKRPGGAALEELVRAVKQAGKLAMADVSNLEEGVNAEKIGFDIVSTTLSGYTPYTLDREKPDLDLIGQLAAKLNIPVIAEGNVKTPQHMLDCLHGGAFCVIVGGAITRPQLITKAFTDALGG